MASFNKVILMGNLTRDPELKTAPSGTKVADLRLAVSESWKDRQSGETRETVCFVDIVVWDRLAELCAQYLRKGSPILVEGRLQLDEWQTPQGEKRSRIRVRANTVKFVGPAPKRDDATGTREGDFEGAGKGGYTQSAPAASSYSKSAPAAIPPDDIEQDDDEDLPF